MKAYTDISQSKKLAEILPIESADGTWKRVAIAGAHLGVPEELQYLHDGDMPFVFYSGVGIPSWSLAALLDVMPVTCDDGRHCLALINSNPNGNVDWLCCYEDCNGNLMMECYGINQVDACYEMILKLNEQNFCDYGKI